MVRLLVLLSTIALAAAAVPSRSSLAAPLFGRRAVSKDILEKKASASTLLELRGGASLDPELYVKACSAVYGLYGAKCLFMTDSMVTDHLEAPAPDGLTKFWIRGMSGFMATMVFCFLKLPTDVAAKACLLASSTTGFLFPWNGKVMCEFELFPCYHQLVLTFVSWFTRITVSLPC